MALAVRINLKGLKEVNAALKLKDKRLDKSLKPTVARINTLLLQKTLKVFADAGRGKVPATWPRYPGGQFLAPLTRFVRAFRTSPRAKRGGKDKPKPLSDTGLLRNSNISFLRKTGRGRVEFGVLNTARYAALQHFGGTSPGNTVTVQRSLRVKAKKGGFKNKKITYKMRIGAHRIPARPFLPNKKEWLPQVLRLVRAYIKSATGGK